MCPSTCFYLTIASSCLRSYCVHHDGPRHAVPLKYLGWPFHTLVIGRPLETSGGGRARAGTALKAPPTIATSARAIAELLLEALLGVGVILYHCCLAYIHPHPSSLANVEETAISVTSWHSPMCDLKPSSILISRALLWPLRLG